MRLDHVIFACPRGLDAGAEWLQREYGLPTLPGGEHPNLGTANRILPLVRGSYLELVAVADPTVAAGTAFGQLIARICESDRSRGREGSQSARPIPAAWSVAVRDLDAEAARLGLRPTPASRVRPDGVRLRWRLAGVEAAAAAPYLPFLIGWDVPPEWHPSAAPYAGPIVTLVELRVSGDQTRLSDWLEGGLEGVPVVVRPGVPAICGCVIEAEDRTIVL